MPLLGFRARSFIRKTLPDSMLRRIRHNRKKRVARRLELAKKEAIFRYGYFGPNELYEELSAIPIQKGGVLLVHSSFGNFYNFDGTSEDMLNVLERLVGAEGTLMMPAHSHYNENGPFVFDVRKSPAQTGLLCELFRRRPGVVRSLHPTHSICAKGPLARDLVAEHHKDPFSCGPLSPYAKLAGYSADILGLGLPSGYTTFLHVVEDEDIETYPLRVYADRIYEFTMIDDNGRQLILNLKRRDFRLGDTYNLPRLVRHLSAECYQDFAVHGVPCFRAKAKTLLEELRSLKSRGILLYS
jgi:aminoglycoside N3'-acetyltransferase